MKFLQQATFSLFFILPMFFPASQLAAKDNAVLAPILHLLLLNQDYAKVSWENEFNLPAQDTAGFSILTPSDDSRLLYVSSSEGDDTTATIYAPSDTAIGSDPYLPQEPLNSFATISAALANTRDGYPDYILLKRGDSWDLGSAITLKSGRSVKERTVLTAYGDTTRRPIVHNAGVLLNNASYSAVTGISFTASSRNPSASDFVGFNNVVNNSGIYLLSGYGNTVSGGVLIEDCSFTWFSNNVIQDSLSHGGVLPYLKDIIIRRNIFAHNYSTTSHSQGLFSSFSSILLEENIFDHNGWYQQGEDDETSEGMATIYNHNTYFANVRETIFRNNIFLRSSSIQNKFSSNTLSGTNEIKSWDILLYNNFYAEGEIITSLGGNDDQDNGPRWQNIRVIDNVGTHIGRTHPTGRSLGWGIYISDWQGGYVLGNILTNWGDSSTLTNTFGIQVHGHSTDIMVKDNIMDGIVSTSPLVSFSDGDISNGMIFSDNIIQSTVEQSATSKVRLLATTLNAEENTFSNNIFFSANDTSTWFSIGDTKYASFAEYQSATGDSSSMTEQVTFADATRTLESYLSENGFAADMDSFAAELEQQSRFSWRKELTAQAINSYFRKGFRQL